MREKGKESPKGFIFCPFLTVVRSNPKIQAISIKQLIGRIRDCKIGRESAETEFIFSIRKQALILPVASANNALT
jgi:hypothetical protein